MTILITNKNRKYPKNLKASQKSVFLGTQIAILIKNITLFVPSIFFSPVIDISCKFNPLLRVEYDL